MKSQSEKSSAHIALQPNKISPRHRVLMRRLIAGERAGDIAKDLGFDVARVSVIINSPLFQEEMETMRQNLDERFVDAEADKTVRANGVRDRLEVLSDDAVSTLSDALSDEKSGQVRVSAAREILDRAGYIKEDKVKASISVLPSKELLDMITRVKGDK